jgi:hypothetical protein
VSAPTPLPAFRPIEKPRSAPAPAPSVASVASVDAALERQDRARERRAEGGFARTEIQEDAGDGPNSRGFMPTQLDKPF